MTLYAFDGTWNSDETGENNVQDANWFALIGALGNDDDDLFLIGDCTLQYTASQEVDLYLFANDIPSKYGNNKGFLPVTIQRIE